MIQPKHTFVKYYLDGKYGVDSHTLLSLSSLLTIMAGYPLLRKVRI
ncbi:hypothetical protein BR63_08215 [Thermanaerosceptrum fracticalcis]|uniref:Uncharacterized protein n=1 Tax=Thermanaerosceptrum fracticalcis TaxID=1712410 RepID=A0A7G6E2J3_THEFR|nr:hypothetical protein [Thermanaerosceptrum fracticalcis]QNB46297.1 hypothetical protein BR63_08215 [Thermanaerosceptrum fracticalcis]